MSISSAALSDFWKCPEGDVWLEAMQAWFSGGTPVSVKDFPWYGQDYPDPRFLMVRDRFIQMAGFAVPNAECVTRLASLGPMVEVGAGSGLLSRLVNATGGDCVATDPVCGEYDLPYGQHGVVEALDGAAALERYPTRTVLMSWPCMGRAWSADVLEAMVAGQCLVYVGEGEGGCTASERFFELLDALFEETDALPWLPFPALHDRATVFRKR
jgi:hypothetical protein